MYSNIETYRPGIALVSDDQVLDAVAGGVDIGDAVLNTFLANKWVTSVAGVLYGLYLYGEPTNRTKVINICKQIAAGATQAGRDAVYLGIAAQTGVATWIRNYFQARAGNNTATTTAGVCPAV
ncbi:MAG: hypothetical protein KF800_15385 [Lysobacter sp.]|nr:hypothetical protein [Lysobacter sp.]